MPASLRRCALAVVLAAPLFGVLACGDQPAQHLAPGLWVAYPASVFGDAGPIHIVHVPTGQEQEIGGDATYKSLTWSPDGSQVAAVRVGPVPELVLLATVAGTTGRALPLDSPDTALYWSPDGLRIAAVSPGSALLLTPTLEVVARYQVPAAVPVAGVVGEGLWSAGGDYFAVPFHDRVLVAGPSSRWSLLDPVDFVRYPGETETVTVMDWESEGALAVFEETARRGPTRYVLDMREDPPRLASSSDYPEGAGPMDGLIAGAFEAAGGRAVTVGRRGQPGAARWVVAEPSSPGDAPALFVREDGDFHAILAGRFTGVDPAAMAANVGLLLLAETGDR